MAPTVSFGEKHSVTTMFNAEGNKVQWYIDICLKNGFENGVPWMDDLYLDVVALPSGEVIQLDEDELEALNRGFISKNIYDLAWDEVRKIKGQITINHFVFIKLANEHKSILEKELV